MAPLASLATITSGLEAVATGFSALPLWFVLGGHVVFCAHHFKGKYGDRYLLNLILGFSLAFGGGILTSILLQVRDQKDVRTVAAAPARAGGVHRRIGLA